MKGVKSFIIGFSLSLASVSAYGQLFHLPTPDKNISSLERNIKIDLFRAAPTADAKPVNIFAAIQKTSLTEKAPAAAPQEIQVTNADTNAPEDDEILSVNIDGRIPIELEDAGRATTTADIAHFEDDEISAMLPTHIDSNDADFSTDTPWVVAKGSKHIKNKQLLEDFDTTKNQPQLTDDFILTLEDSEQSSYDVAERIKSSIIFPIPSEILNDENLVPTFIKKTQKAPSSAAKQQKAPPTEVKQTPDTADRGLKIITKAPIQEDAGKDNSKGLLNSISSWFSPNEESKPVAPVKTTPSYSSQEKAAYSQPVPSNNNEFVNFYKTLQETSAAHKNNTIIPSELKLSFQPERAEISGQTLRWLKAFSEAAQNDDTYLQVRLDVSASTELQKKRLNLLYTIFMNNGVDFKKIDTVFSLTEPNAFIIRTLKLK